MAFNIVGAGNASRHHKACKSFATGLAVALTLLISPSAMATKPSTISVSKNVEDPTPRKAWAISYLLNSVFALEFASTLQGEPPYGLEDSAVSLWKRAAVGLGVARIRGQKLPGIRAVEAAWDNVNLEKKPDLQPIRKWVQSSRLNDSIPVAEISGMIDDSFSVSTHNKAWSKLKYIYDTKSPSCPINIDEIRAFTASTRDLITNQSTPSDSALLSLVKGWSKRKVHCLLFTLSATDHNGSPENDPFYLLQALKRSAMVDDIIVDTLFAVRLLESHNYAEVLRILFDLQGTDPEFRLAYELVQRIYSYRQSGQGDVALRGP